MSELLPYLAFAVSVVACFISGWTALRAGRWRDTEAAKAMTQRVNDAHARLDRHGDRLNVIEADILDLPTKADLAEVKGKVETTCEISARTEKAVERLEHFMMERRD